MIKKFQSNILFWIFIPLFISSASYSLCDQFFTTPYNLTKLYDLKVDNCEVNELYPYASEIFLRNKYACPFFHVIASSEQFLNKKPSIFNFITRSPPK